MTCPLLLHSFYLKVTTYSPLVIILFQSQSIQGNPMLLEVVLSRVQLSKIIQNKNHRISLHWRFIISFFSTKCSTMCSQRWVKYNSATLRYVKIRSVSEHLKALFIINNLNNLWKSNKKENVCYEFKVLIICSHIIEIQLKSDTQSGNES